MADDGPGPWLVERRKLGERQATEFYAPLELPALHRDFANLAGAHDKGYLRFANQYGLLGDSQNLVYPDAVDQQGRHPLYAGESLTRWKRECYRLRTLIDLWDVANGAHNEGEPVDSDLRDRIRWDVNPESGQRAVYHVFENQPDIDADLIARDASPARGDPWGLHPDAIAKWQNEKNAGKEEVDRAAPARFFVAQQVNAKLRGQASPELQEAQGRSSAKEAREWAIVPHTLLAALWVLFGVELTKRALRLKACDYCGRYFPPKRSDQRFCSNSCRQRYFQKTKHKEGRP